jgi:amino acid transporter
MATPAQSGDTASTGAIAAPLGGDANAAGYGLRRAVLSPMETLAQSISTIAPTTSPVATIPLVCALAGNGTWLAYVLATAAVLLVAWCVGRFARYSSSPGSLYSYATMILPPWLGATAAWSLLLAYVCGGASCMGGFYQYAAVMLRDATNHFAFNVFLAALVSIVPMWFAWRDVKISARLMLSFEAASVALIVIVVALVLARQGLHPDLAQLHLRGVNGSGFRLGMVLAVFSFTGFESATTMGAEARDPLRTIPRAVIQSAILGGAFFTICAYAEVLGVSMAGQNLATADAPLHVLATVGGLPALGLLIDIGVLVSLFAGVLACISAAARVLLLMAHNGLAHSGLRATHARNETPGVAIAVSGLAAFIPVGILAARGSSGLDVYGWMGSLATYGFMVAYALVCIALPRYLRDHHGVVNLAAKTIPVLGFIAMLLAVIANLYPVPEGPYGKLPYIYLAYMAVVLLWFAFSPRARSAAREEVSSDA